MQETAIAVEGTCIFFPSVGCDVACTSEVPALVLLHLIVSASLVGG